jgi:hypothetical protein
MTASMHETQLPAQHQTSRQTGTQPGTQAGREARVTDLEQVRADRHTTAQQRREAARSRDLTALLRDRPDLAGVHAPADFAVDSVRWCV